MIQNDSSWTKELPTEAGWWWFYSPELDYPVIIEIHESQAGLLYFAEFNMDSGWSNLSKEAFLYYDPYLWQKVKPYEGAPA